MEFRIFIMPLVNIDNTIGPKYESDLPARWAAMTYGSVPYAILAVEGEVADFVVLDAYPDVVSVNPNFDANLPQAELSGIQAVLEAMRIPADWMNPSMSWREALRTIAGMFQYAQRYNGLYGKELIPETGLALNDRWGDIDPVVQAEYLNTASSFGWNVPTPGDNTSIRQILKAISDFWGSQPFKLGWINF